MRMRKEDSLIKAITIYEDIAKISEANINNINALNNVINNFKF